MAYISSFVYCDGIQTIMTNKGPKQEILTPLQGLFPIAIPSNYTFAISCSVADLDRNKESVVKIQFTSPTNKIVYDTKNVKLPLPPDKSNEKMGNIAQFNIEMRNLPLKEKGLYTTKIFINDQILGEYKIPVQVR